MPVLTSRDVAYLPTNETPSDAIGRASTPGGSTHPESACAVAGISAVNWIGTRVPESGAADANTFHRSIGIGFPEPPQSAEGHATGTLVHDINNLLAVIDSGLRLLDATTDASDRTRLIQNLQGVVERGAALSRKRLGASRPGNVVSSISARHIVDIRDLLGRRLRSDVMVVAEIAPDVCHFRADPEELHLALLNLCKNASDAMSGGGRISINVRNVYTARVGYVEIAVSDEGTGIPRDAFAPTFDSHLRTKASGLGTGLDLDQVRRFVELSGGAVRVESAPDVGTTVRMLFPFAAT